MAKMKPISFRPTIEENKQLKEYMKAHFLEKPSAAIRAMAFQQLKRDSSSMVDKPVKVQGIEQKYYAKLSLIPPNLPNVKREIKKFLRGGNSDLVKTLFEVTPESLNMAFTCATPKGILTLIPCARAIPSTTTHDN